jgi:NAD(P)-dependent dehydrogenase (short-subunit alcohol dehydrogenase family)
MAQALAERGVKIAVLDINLENAEARAAGIGKEGGEAKEFVCDVLDERQLRDVCGKVAAAWGAADILINGARENNPKGSTSVEFLEADQLEDP